MFLIAFVYLHSPIFVAVISFPLSLPFLWRYHFLSIVAAFLPSLRFYYRSVSSSPVLSRPAARFNRQAGPPCRHALSASHHHRRRFTDPVCLFSATIATTMTTRGIMITQSPGR